MGSQSRVRTKYVLDMEIQSIPCMNPGDGENSFTNTLLFQETVISKVRRILEDTIKDMFNTGFPPCFKLADLGCSSGPNTLLVISEIFKIVYEICQEMKCESPEFQVFLNDLPGNDFNYIFKLLLSFSEKLRKEKGDLFGPCFVSGVAGSFFGRLFPRRSLHFFHSSSSLHWLSKVPEGISNNKGNIYMAKSSPPHVFKAYLEQFKKDFSLFLSLRSEEIVPGGRMVLTFLSRSTEDPTSNDCCLYWELLAKSLRYLVSKGLVEESEIDTFNLPHYNPSEGEVRTIIEKQGSFNIDKLEIVAVNWDPNDDVMMTDKNVVFDKKQSGQNVAKLVRAFRETMLASHFGGNIMDELFTRYGEYVGEHQCVEKMKHIYIILSLIKK